MATFTVTPTTAIDDRKAGIIHDYLVAQGLVVESVSIQAQPGDTRVYVIEADQDPTDLIRAFTPPIRTDLQARAVLARLKPFLQAHTISDEDMHNAILALMELTDM